MKESEPERLAIVRAELGALDPLQTIWRREKSTYPWPDIWKKSH